MMNNVTSIESSDRVVLLGHEIDELLLRLRGLVLVRDLLAQRGASRSELDAHTDEIERVRSRLADTIRGRSSSARAA